MKDRYLEVTFRKGKPLAAYLYLPRSVGAKSARTEEALPGILVNFSASGEPIGLEIITPTSVTVSQINVVLAKFCLAAISPEELAPSKLPNPHGSWVTKRGQALPSVAVPVPGSLGLSAGKC